MCCDIAGMHHSSVLTGEKYDKFKRVLQINISLIYSHKETGKPILGRFFWSFDQDLWAFGGLCTGIVLFTPFFNCWLMCTNSFDGVLN